MMPQAVLEIPIRCPDGPEKCIECAECVRRRLLGRPGIRDVSVKPDGDVAHITLHYDSQQLTMNDLEREVRRHGGCFSPEWGHAVLAIDGMVSPQSQQIIESVLNRIPGVMATASYASGLVRLEFDKKRCAVPQVVERLEKLGYRARPGAPASGEEAPGRTPARPRVPTITRVLSWLARNPELAMPLIGACFLVAAYVVYRSEGSYGLRTILLTASFLCSARFTGVETIRALWHFKIDIEVLMFVAAGGAIALGHYEEGALLLVLFGLGSAGENMAMDRARRAISALAELAPDTAILRDRDGIEREVRAADLQIGDHVIIRPFERMPVDGTVHSGNSPVDQSPITGESVPVDKSPGDVLLAGTINGDGVLVMSVSHRVQETKLAKIIKLVAEAQTTKSPTQVLTDRVERWYVPAVLVVTALLLTVPPIVAGGAWGDWFYRAMAFLTAASPCALAIGTPAAVLSGIARAARGGVLIKGGVHLENLGRVRVMAFDKTGTLTRGRPQVVAVDPMEAFSPEELLRLVAGIEQEVSAHPLAAAIVKEAQARKIVVPASHDTRQITGIGVTGRVEGRRVAVGRPQWNRLAGWPELARKVQDMEEAGNTAVVAMVDDQPAGVIGIADLPRDGARGALARLRSLGIQRTVMLTGDNARVAQAISGQIGVDEFHAGLMPEEKVGKLQELATRYGRTAMVGDGVNDAPALASATVGIAMGGAGTDVALETADVALMSDALEKLPEAIGLSRLSRRIIAQNLCIALGVILVMAPAAAMNWATLGIAVVAHEGSTVLVVLNALRLLVYKAK
jgi:Cd2+/Zn2+-exporting ATPase